MNFRYTISEMIFHSENAVKIWIWKNQGNRRNLTSFAKIELAMKMKPILEADAKERKRPAGGNHGTQETGGNVADVEKLPPAAKGKVRDELAEQAGVSGRTYEKGAYILEHADDETKDKLRRSEKGVSISGVYNKLKSQGKTEVSSESTEPAEQLSVPAPSEPTKEFDVKETTDETFIDPMAAMSEEERQAYEWSNNRVNLKMISRILPSSLIGCLLEVFDAEYRHKFIPELLEGMIRVEGKESVRGLVKQIYKKYSK